MIPFLLQKQILEQLQSDHIVIKKTRLRARESVYQVNINADIKNTVKQCAKCLAYQQAQPHEKTIPYKLPSKPLIFFF